MTVAIYGAGNEHIDYRVANTDGTVDVIATWAKLREAEKILERAVAERELQRQMALSGGGDENGR